MKKVFGSIAGFFLSFIPFIYAFGVSYIISILMNF